LAITFTTVLYLQAVDTLLRCLRQGQRPHLAYASVPIGVSGEMSNTADEPCRSLYSTALHAADRLPGRALTLPPTPRIVTLVGCQGSWIAPSSSGRFRDRRLGFRLTDRDLGSDSSLCFMSPAPPNAPIYGHIHRYVWADEPRTAASVIVTGRDPHPQPSPPTLTLNPSPTGLDRAGVANPNPNPNPSLHFQPQQLQQTANSAKTKYQNKSKHPHALRRDFLYDFLSLI
jgi:hypothetical protein